MMTGTVMHACSVYSSVSPWQATALLGRGHGGAPGERRQGPPDVFQCVLRARVGVPSPGPATPEVITIPKHKKYPPAGDKSSTRTAAIWIDAVDAQLIGENEEARRAQAEQREGGCARLTHSRLDACARAARA
jgi:hypothetical protein